MSFKESGRIIVNLVGDVMIGRLIDQLLPTSVDNEEEASIVSQFRSSQGSRCLHLQEGKYNYQTIWGNTLSRWKEGNLNIINLETSITTNDKLWPNKMFNYRTHPANVACLTAANIHHVSLANNHTLDFGVKGLEQTSETLRKCNISYVGAGKTRSEAIGPVYLDISSNNENGKSIRVSFLSASDHPLDWHSVPSFHLLNNSDLPTLCSHLGPLIATARSNSDLVIFSIHWGPNYQWIPDKKIKELGRWLIEEGVDIIHGHSSHHIQGIEIIERQNGSIGFIIYGCGDFIDDYALNEQYRNDLSAIFQLNISFKESQLIELHSISIFPTRCEHFQVNQLNLNDKDWKWIKEKLIELSDIGKRKWNIRNNGELFIQI